MDKKAMYSLARRIMEKTAAARKVTTVVESTSDSEWGNELQKKMKQTKQSPKKIMDDAEKDVKRVKKEMEDVQDAAMKAWGKSASAPAKPKADKPQPETITFTPIKKNIQIGNNRSGINDTVSPEVTVPVPPAEKAVKTVSKVAPKVTSTYKEVAPQVEAVADEVREASSAVEKGYNNVVPVFRKRWGRR